jgi:branched-chain amino acid transport system ATP-binding protein
MGECRAARRLWNLTRADRVPAADLFAIIGEMKERGCTILLVEQNVQHALTACDRFIAIERGRIVQSGKASNNNDCDNLMKAISF